MMAKNSSSSLTFNRFGLVFVMLFSCGVALAKSDDEYTQELYDDYCKACHSTPSTGAPQIHDQKVWTAKLKKPGLDTLTLNAVKGIGNMPPQGGCQECEYEDFVDLIQLMAKAKKPEKK